MTIHVNQLLQVCHGKAKLTEKVKAEGKGHRALGIGLNKAERCKAEGRKGGRQGTLDEVKRAEKRKRQKRRKSSKSKKTLDTGTPFRGQRGNS